MSVKYYLKKNEENEGYHHSFSNYLSVFSMVIVRDNLTLIHKC